MNKDTWFRILQVAVVVPFIYTLSEDQKNVYFKLGLKLVAGAVLVMNIQPLIREAQPLIQAVVKLQSDAAKIDAQEKANAIEGEFTPAAS